jgi:hypothetical protein
MQRYDIINHFIRTRGYTSYLEIGVQRPSQCFDKIICEHKEGVDPDCSSQATHIMTSDEFFASTCERTYSVIFIDGYHSASQVEKDVQNALKFLNPNGVIILHDCLPKTEKEQLPEMQSGDWTGDVWKAWIKIRYGIIWRSYTINTDHGCGVIDTSQTCPHNILNFGMGERLMPPVAEEDMTWAWFCENKDWALSVRNDIQ